MSLPFLPFVLSPARAQADACTLRRSPPRSSSTPTLDWPAADFLNNLGRFLGSATHCLLQAGCGIPDNPISGGISPRSWSLTGPAVASEPGPRTLTDAVFIGLHTDPRTEQLMQRFFWLSHRMTVGSQPQRTPARSRLLDFALNWKCSNAATCSARLQS